MDSGTNSGHEPTGPCVACDGYFQVCWFSKELVRKLTIADSRQHPSTSQVMYPEISFFFENSKISVQQCPYLLFFFGVVLFSADPAVVHC